MSKERPALTSKSTPEAKKPRKEAPLRAEKVHRSAEQAPVMVSVEERDEELTLLRRQLGIERPTLSEVGRALLLRFAERVKGTLPREDHAVKQKVTASPAHRLVQALAFAGVQLVAQGAEAQTRHEAHRSHAHRAHVQERTHLQSAHHRQEPERRAEARPVGLGFELIGISSSELAALVADSFPPFIFGHQRISLIRYVADDAPAQDQSINGFVPTASTAWHETARHEQLHTGGQITIRAEAFREMKDIFPGLETNFWEAIGTLVHEIGHSARPRRFFIEQAQTAEHLAISEYSEEFLRVRKVGRRPDYIRMGGEMQSDLLKAIYFYAPLGSERLEDWAVERLQQAHPTTPRELIVQNVRELFALAPGFDWDAGIARFRKGTRALYDQFSRAKIEYALLRVPTQLRELLPDMSRDRIDAPPSLAEQLTFDSRLQENQALQQHYQQYRATQTDALRTEAARLNLDVPGFAGLHASWEEAVEGVMRFEAYRRKNNTVLTEYQVETIGHHDRARQAELPIIIQSIRGAELSSAWSRIPTEQRSAVHAFLQREAQVRLHREVVPPVIAEEAQRVLQGYQLQSL